MQDKNLKLEPTNKAGIYNVYLCDGFSKKKIGKYNEFNQTFSCFRSERKHLHRNSNSLAVNQSVLEIQGLRWICINYQDKNGFQIELKTSKDFFIANGKRAAFKATNYETQYFLPLPMWGLSCVQQFEQQRHSQQSLFEAA